MSVGPDETTVLVVEDDEHMRALIACVLRDGGYAVSEAENGDVALRALRRSRPDVAVLDVNVPLASGYELCRSLREAYGDAVAILLVSGERTESFDRVGGLLLGADDYLVKPFAPGELLARVQALTRRSGAGAAGAAAGLTPRETEVLSLLAQGLDQPQIAAQLTISSKTVSTHIERVLAKLCVRSRAQAVAAAYRLRLVDGTGAAAD